MDEMTIELIIRIIGIVLLALTTYFGVRYKKAKKVISDIAELISDVDKSLKDDTITKDELKEIIEDVKQIIEDFKG